jgi:hypothetical protein
VAAGNSLGAAGSSEGGGEESPTAATPAPSAILGAEAVDPATEEAIRKADAEFQALTMPEAAAPEAAGAAGQQAEGGKGDEPEGKGE